MYSTNCVRKPSSSVIKALESVSSAPGRGSGRGGLALACSAGDGLGGNANPNVFGKVGKVDTAGFGAGMAAAVIVDGLKEIG